MGHFSILTVNHDRVHEDIADPHLSDKLHDVLFTGLLHGIPSQDERRELRKLRDMPKSLELAYTSHADTCPVLAFSHGYIKGELGHLQIPRYDDKSLDDYLISVAKARGFVIYKK